MTSLAQLRPAVMLLACTGCYCCLFSPEIASEESHLLLEWRESQIAQPATQSHAHSAVSLLPRRLLCGQDDRQFQPAAITPTPNHGKYDEIHRIQGTGASTTAPALFGGSTTEALVLPGCWYRQTFLLPDGNSPMTVTIELGFVAFTPSDRTVMIQF